MVSVDLEYPDELTDFVTRLEIDADNKFKSRRSIDEQVQTENHSTGQQKETEKERAAGQQERPPISNKPRVPTRKADLRRWNIIWNIVRGKIKTYRNIKALCEWFNESQARTPGTTAIGTAPQREKAKERYLKCSEDTMADIVAAGEAGLLEFPNIP
jgi:hypothetical protein